MPNWPYIATVITEATGSQAANSGTYISVSGTSSFSGKGDKWVVTSANSEIRLPSNPSAGQFFGLYNTANSTMVLSSSNPIYDSNSGLVNVMTMSNQGDFVAAVFMSGTSSGSMWVTPLSGNWNSINSGSNTATSSWSAQTFSPVSQSFTGSIQGSGSNYSHFVNWNSNGMSGSLRLPNSGTKGQRVFVRFSADYAHNVLVLSATNGDVFSGSNYSTGSSTGSQLILTGTRSEYLHMVNDGSGSWYEVASTRLAQYKTINTASITGTVSGTSYFVPPFEDYYLYADTTSGTISIYLPTNTGMTPGNTQRRVWVVDGGNAADNPVYIQTSDASSAIFDGGSITSSLTMSTSGGRAEFVQQRNQWFVTNWPLSLQQLVG